MSEKILGYLNNYRFSKSNVIRLASYPVDWADRARRIRDRDDNRCSICGRSNLVTHVHHIELVSKGGSSSEANLITVCESCHAKLHNTSQNVRVDSLQSNGFFCINCDRFYSVDYGRTHQVCSICNSQLVPWFTDRKD